MQLVLDDFSDRWSDLGTPQVIVIFIVECLMSFFNVIEIEIKIKDVSVHLMLVN